MFGSQANRPGCRIKPTAEHALAPRCRAGKSRVGAIDTLVLMGERQRGIYVEILIDATLDRIWQFTQEPDQHQRWDLRFTRINYLPKAVSSEPQRFSYETRIGFGLAVCGTGESLGDRAGTNGDVSSSLKFASEDPKSLIRKGSGYWKYVPTEKGLRFFTWYDYEVRFGALGRLIDRIAFRPLITWATAWSFDRLRLWVEFQQSPETSMMLLAIHSIARLSIAFVWIWQGLIPKLLFRNIDERHMLAQAGVPLELLPWIGVSEVLVGLMILLAWRVRAVLIVLAAAMIGITVIVAAKSPSYFTAAFNPMTLNLSVFTLAMTGWMASKNIPSALKCLRVNPNDRA